MKPSVLFWTVVCGMAGVSSIASAQDQVWLKDRRFTEGPGYRVGDFELHPGAAAEFGFDSNYLHRPPAASSTSSGPLPSLRLRITPSFSISTLSQQRLDAGAPPPTVQFRGNVSATYNEFIPVSTTGSQDIQKQRNVGVALDSALQVYPGHTWSGNLNLGYMRLLTPTEQGIRYDAQGESYAYNFNRNLPRASAEIVWTPGAGLFDWRIGYQFAGTFFENTDFAKLNSIHNTVMTRGRWRFLPRTALQYEAQFGFLSYLNRADPASGGKLSSHPMRARFGLSGLVTPSFQLLLMGGWGASFYTGAPAASATVAGPQDFDSFIGQTELKWYFNPNPSSDPNATPLNLSGLAVGFVRDFNDSLLGSTYYERDRGYLNFSYLFRGRFLFVAEGGAGPVIFPRVNVAGVSSVMQFTDIRVDASLFGEYRFSDALGINATARYNENFSGQAPFTVTDTSGNSSIASFAFRQMEAYLGFRWLM